MADNAHISMSDFLLLKWPHGPEIVLAAFSLSTAIKASDACRGRHMYWAESLLYSILISFGGGILAPFLIGVPPVIFTNDLALMFGIVSWFLLWRTRPFIKAMEDVAGMKQILVFLAELARFHSIAGMVVMANGTIQGRAYNSSLGQHDPPIWGPVILGTIAGSGGLFLPFDRGLSSLKDGAPHTLKLVEHVGSYDNNMATAILLGIFVGRSVLLSTADWFYTAPKASNPKRKTQ